MLDTLLNNQMAVAFLDTRPKNQKLCIFFSRFKCMQYTFESECRRQGRKERRFIDHMVMSKNTIEQTGHP